MVSTVFAATTGIIGASVVAMGLMAGPALLRSGYQKELTSGIICSSGTLGILIPPTIMLVVYGGLTGLKETSVGNLFAGAILPGLILSGLYFAYVGMRCVINPKLGPPISKEEASKWSARQKLIMTLKSLVPPFGLILIVMGTILAGIATPTEAAALGAIGALFWRRSTALQLEGDRQGHPGHGENHRHGHAPVRRRHAFQHGFPEHGRWRRRGRPVMAAA